MADHQHLPGCDGSGAGCWVVLHPRCQRCSKAATGGHVCGGAGRLCGDCCCENWASDHGEPHAWDTQYLRCAACQDAPAGKTGLCGECLDAGDDEPLPVDPWLDELGPIGGGQ